jgi:Winged helix DNA-binding domain
VIPTLTRRALNRATLARQLLLERADLTTEQAVEHLVGLQAQTPHTWYTGLWTRLHDFDPEKTGAMLADRGLVRMALMRSTIHLVTARDAVALRPPLDQVVRRPLAGVHRRAVDGIDLTELIAAGREAVDADPRTFSELGTFLAQRWPDRDPGALALAVRALLPLVQVPPRGVWGRSGRALHTSLAAWLPHVRAEPATAADLVLRYLGAFGPASVRDMQNWSGLSRLQEIVDALRPHLMTFRDADGRELFDRPGSPRPDPDSPAPVRFIYDFDNLLLGHDDRSRVVSDAHTRIDFGERMEMPAAFLVDGMTAGMWRCIVHRKVATMALAPIVRLTADAQAELTAEAERLGAFLAPKAHEHRVRMIAGGWPALRDLGISALENER